MTVSLQDAQAGLADLIHHLTPGEPVFITEGDRPIAVLSSVQRRELGLLKGKLEILADDDDHFAEYMP